jgi:uncharacterized protein (DUF736 family)
MSNGKMKVSNDRVTGFFTCYALALNFWLEKNTNRFSDKAPHFVVMGRAPAGHSFQAGVAWEYIIKSGKSVGEIMYSITLDDPAFGEKPINLTAYPSAMGEWDVSIERKRAEQASPKEEAAQGSEIPFDAPAAA